MSIVLLAIKASLVLGAALLAVQAAARARAATRHLVLAAGFLALLVMPAGMRLLPERPVWLPLAPRVSAIVVSEPAPFETATARMPDAQVGPSQRLPALSLATAIVIVWAIGAIVSLLPLVAGVRELRRLTRHAARWDRGMLLLAELGVERPIAGTPLVLLHDAVCGPMTFGVFRPVIVFPSDASQWDAADLRSAMRHELEHVRRADCLVSTLARAICAIYWVHPLVWMSWQRLRLEAERACDDAVVQVSDPLAYAEQLVALAERASTADRYVLAMTGGGDLRRRVNAILDRAQRRGRAGGAQTVFVVCVGLAGAGLIAPVSGASQGPPLPPLSFEVASVKPNVSGVPGEGGDRLSIRIDPGGRFSARNASLRDLLLMAYRWEITSRQLGPLEDWMLRRRFDIDARVAEGLVSAIDRRSAETMDRHLQGLLTDRFQLRVRREWRTGDIYVLSVAPGGARLKPAKTAEACAGGADPLRVKPLTSGLLPCHLFPRFGRRGFEAIAVDTADLAHVLRDVVGAPVEDRAALPTLFDAVVNWNNRLVGTPREIDNGEPQPGEDDPDIFTALREQLGLRLEPQRGMVETLVVESAQPPSPD